LFGLLISYPFEINDPTIFNCELGEFNVNLKKTPNDQTVYMVQSNNDNDPLGDRQEYSLKNSTTVGGKRKSKKSSKKGSKRGSKKSSKKSSKKGSKRGSKKMKGGKKTSKRSSKKGKKTSGKKSSKRKSKKTSKK
jgi:hypothetical protein